MYLKNRLRQIELGSVIVIWKIKKHANGIWPLVQISMKKECQKNNVKITNVSMAINTSIFKLSFVLNCSEP